MHTDTQSDALRFLSTGEAYGLPGARVDRIDTHISVVFLVADRAYKLKRAVRFDYVDFSTLDLRRRCCEAEVALNRRTAPSLYRGVVPVCRRPDGTLALGGAGTPFEWLVEMARFDEATLFDRQAEAGTLSVGRVRELTDAVARFHAIAEVRTDHGGAPGMSWVVDGNVADLADHEGRPFDAPSLAALAARTREALALHGSRLDARRARGCVRHCHGDLHLRNICLVDGRPTLFDAVEFNDEISCVDVWYDVAFLLMDLVHRRLIGHANAVLNEYLDLTGDIDGLAVLPLFLSCRAAVRAKIDATAAEVQAAPDRARALEDEAREYLTQALAFLTRPSPQLVAIGGLSGTGKSTLARSLAPLLGAPPGALVVRSDIVRKRLLGARDVTTRLDPSAYVPAVSSEVYRTLEARAAHILETGETVIVDAVFQREADRSAIEAVARSAGARFTGLWLDAQRDIVEARLSARHDDASDATVEVYRNQRGQDVGELTWARLDASTPTEAIVGEALRRLA
ncbi:MAG: AAA family ATPase [Vicinamibacterales bacterium]